MAKPRVFISTDIGAGDHDDDQSLVHALLYSDQMNIVGFSQTVAAKHPGGSKADIIEVIDVYAKDYANLKTYGGYPTPEYLRSVTHQGATVAAPSAGYSHATEGSKAIVAAARAANPNDPLYVLTWGGETDIAQALHDAPDIAPNVRVITIGRQDPNAADYLLKEWKGDVWWLHATSSYRGIYADGLFNRPTPGSGEWVYNNAKGHGALGDYFDQLSHGLWDGALQNNTGYGIKMGDTPSVLYILDLIRTGRADPTVEGWAGEYVKKATNYWTDNTDPALKLGIWNGAQTVAEDRAAIFKDFATRLDRADNPNPNVVAKPPAPAPTAPAPAPTQPAPAPVDSSTAKTFIGTKQNDTYTVTSSKDVIKESWGGGTDLIKTSVDFIMPDNVENMTLTGSAVKGVGNTMNNHIEGNDLANRLEGGNGNDWLDGKAGNDTMVGGQGSDIFIVRDAGDVVVERANEGWDQVHSTVSFTLPEHVEDLMLKGPAIKGVGNSGNNVISGNGVNNIIVGGKGNDKLTGGDGSDTFVFGAGFGKDVIVDFKIGVDKLDVSGMGGVKPKITSSNGSAVLGWGTDTITLVGVSANDGALLAMLG